MEKSHSFEDLYRTMKAVEYRNGFPFVPHPQLIDYGRFTMNPKLWLKIVSVALLTIVPVVGLTEVVRSEGVVQQPVNQSQTINQLIQQLKTGDEETRSSAAFVLGNMGESAKSAIPSLIPLLKDSDADVRSSATDALKKLGYQF